MRTDTKTSAWVRKLVEMLLRHFSAKFNWKFRARYSRCCWKMETTFAFCGRQFVEYNLIPITVRANGRTGRMRNASLCLRLQLCRIHCLLPRDIKWRIMHTEWARSWFWPHKSLAGKQARNLVALNLHNFHCCFDGAALVAF